MKRLVTILATAAIGVTGCGGDSGGSTASDQGAKGQGTRLQLNGADKPDRATFPKPAGGLTLQGIANSINASGTEVALAGSVFTPGPNRVAFGVIQGGKAVYGPSAVYVARDPDKGRAAGPFLAPADVLLTEAAFRSKQAATEDDPFAAIYEATGVPFDKPGKYYVLVATQLGRQLVAGSARLTVRKDSPIPDVGDPAPRVDTDVVGVDGPEKAIDTRIPPAPELHKESFKDVVGKKPVALLFATPQLCESRVCGPVVDIALQLKQRYGDQISFIHQEVYRDNDPNKGLREPLAKFKLQTEPWLFAIGADGRVAARLEGSFGIKAFERSLKAAIGPSS